MHTHIWRCQALGANEQNKNTDGVVLRRFWRREHMHAGTNDVSDINNISSYRSSLTSSSDIIKLIGEPDPLCLNTRIACTPFKLLAHLVTNVHHVLLGFIAVIDATKRNHLRFCASLRSETHDECFLVPVLVLMEFDLEM